MQSARNSPHLTLRQLFNRRLLLLLLTFSAAISSIIALTYRQQADRLNRAAMSASLQHLQPRLVDQQRIWQEDAEHLLNITTWSGLAFLHEPLRHEKLQSFYTAQAESLEFEGVVIYETASGKPIFDFWRNYEKPEFHGALLDQQPFWFDPAHAVLYSKISLPLHGPNQQLTMLF